MSARSPAIRWYGAAGAAVLGGMAIAAAFIVHAVQSVPGPVQFAAPGSLSIEVPKPATYVVWHEHRTTFQGRSYDEEERLPRGMRMQVLGPDGTQIPVRRSSGSWESGNDGTKRAAVTEFDAKQAGRYTVSAGGATQPRILSVSPAFFRALFVDIGAAIGAAVLGFGAATALGLYGFLRYLPEAGAPNGPGDQPLRKVVAVVYGLQASSLVLGLPLIAAVIVDYLKRPEAEGTWLDSHVRWQIRTFWWTMLWTVLGLATAVLVVGVLVLFAAAVWLVYRVAKGWSELNEGRPMYRAAAATSPPP